MKRIKYFLESIKEEFKEGDRVIKNEENWIWNEFDSWGRGEGIGQIVKITNDTLVDVRWPGGRCYEEIDQIKKIVVN